MTQNLSFTRPQVLRLLLIAIMAIFVVRLGYLQIIKHGYYTEAARAIQVTPLTIVPERGELYVNEAGKLVPLVLNERVFTVFVDPQAISDEDKVIQTLRSVAGGELEGDIVKLISDEDETVRYRVVARNVTRKQAELIKQEELSGVGLQQTNRRFYPEGAMAGQTLGYLNSEGKGQYGIEGALNDELSGTEGQLETVTDVNQIPLTIGEQNIASEAKDGQDYVLNIDRVIQFKAEQVLKERLVSAKATKGSVVVMNPNSGAVLAMASQPTYDPAKYFDVEDFQTLQNPAVSQPFENGSVIKALTMGAGLDSGAVTVNSTFADGTGCTKVQDREICNVEEDPRKAQASMLDILRYSLNTGVVHIVRQMGGGGDINKQARDTLYDYFHNKYRFGEKTGIEQAGESAGIIISPDKQEGNAVRYANMSFGQGMDQTMIQTMAAFSAEVNGGTYYQPQLVDGTIDDSGVVTDKKPNVVDDSVISEQASKDARELIYQGRNKGFFGQFDRDGYKVGGKTGTSQVIDPVTGRYSDENSIGTYLGFGGVESPEYVIMVKVDDSSLPGYQGTTAAGPIFNDMSDWMIDYLQLEPKR